MGDNPAVVDMPYRCADGWSDEVLVDGQRRLWRCAEYLEGCIVEAVHLHLIDMTTVHAKVAEEARRGQEHLVDRLMKVDAFRAAPVVGNEFNWRDPSGAWHRRYTDVLDGVHRLAAAERRGWATLDLEVVRFWFWPRSVRPTDRRHVTCSGPARPG